MRVFGSMPMMRTPQAKPVKFGDAPETDEDVRQELADKLLEKGIGQNALTKVMGMDFAEGFEILVWTLPGKEQQVMKALAELTGAPLNPKSNVFEYKGRKVSVWPDMPLSPFNGGIGPFGPPQLK